jgi:hypothetical protein
MDPDEAITLLLRSTRQPSEPEDPNAQNRRIAQGIASELGYLALAVPVHSPMPLLANGDAPLSNIWPLLGS